jgi:MscS family membrane protein
MNFLDITFLNNTVHQYLIVFGAALFAFVLKFVITKILQVLNLKFIQQKWQFVTNQEFTSLVAKPLSRFVFVAITILAIDKLNYPSTFLFTIRKIPIYEIFQKFGDSLIIIYFFYFLTKAINFIALVLVKSTSGPNDKGHDQIVIFLRDLIKIGIGILGALLLLKIVFNQNISNLLTGLSIVGAAVALAAKESIENLIASFIIFFDKPFFTGDTLKVNNVSGTVEHIGLRSTRIRTPERTLVTVPNKQMVDSVVDNMSMRNLRRAEIKLALSDKTTAVQIQSFIKNVDELIIAKSKEIEKHSIHFTELSKDGYVVLLEFFTPAFSRAEYDVVKQNINFAIMDMLQKNKIEMSSGASNISIVQQDGQMIIPKQDGLL